jgi:hypothetical protein
MLDSLLLTLAGLASVFGWAFFSFWSAIPAGIALSLSPVWVGLTVTLSYMAGVLLVVIVGAPIRQRIYTRMNISADDPLATMATSERRTLRWVAMAWQRYGLVGLALLAPMTVGAQIGAVVGMGFGARPLRLLVAMTLGAGVWALGLTLAVVLGVTTLLPAG